MQIRLCKPSRGQPWTNGVISTLVWLNVDTASSIHGIGARNFEGMM